MKKSAWDVYVETVTPARKIRNEAVSQAYEIYEEVEAQAEMVYKKIQVKAYQNYLIVKPLREALEQLEIEYELLDTICEERKNEPST